MLEVFNDLRSLKKNRRTLPLCTIWCEKRSDLTLVLNYVLVVMIYAKSINFIISGIFYLSSHLIIIITTPELLLVPTWTNCVLLVESSPLPFFIEH